MMKFSITRINVNKILIPFAIITTVITAGFFLESNTSSKVTPKLYDVDSSIEFIGKENVKATNNEIWIKGFLIDGNYVEATAFGVPIGWEESSGFLHAYGSKEDKSFIRITLSGIESIFIIVAKSESSGILCVTGGGQTKQIDLYSEKNIDEEFIPVSIGLTPSKSYGQIFPGIILVIACISLLLSIIINTNRMTITRISLELKPQLIKALILSAFIFSITVILGVAGEIPAKYDYDAEIVFTGKKSDISLSNVVWVKSIDIDGVTILAADYMTPNGWKVYEGYLRGDGIAEGKIPIPLYFSNKDNVKIVFGRDNSSGIVRIRTGHRVQIIDLFGEGDVEITLDAGKTAHVISAEKIVQYGSVSIICFILLALSVRNNRKWIVILPIFLWELVFLNHPFFYFNQQTIIIMFIISSLSGFATYRSFKESRMKKYWSVSGILGLIIISCYSAFAITGGPLILKKYTVNLSEDSISYTLLLAILLSFFIISFLYVLEVIFPKVVDARRQNQISERHAFLLFFFIMALVYAGSIYIFSPGNVTVDNLNIIRESRAGVRTVPNPIYYYWYISFLDRFDPSQHLNTIIQCAFFSAIVSAYLAHLYNKGLKLRFATITVFLFAIYPANIIGQVTQVNDYLSSSAILWLVYLIMKLIDKPDYFWNLGNVSQLFLSLFIIMNFRLNGVIPGYLSILFIILLILKHGTQQRKAFQYLLGSVVGLVALGIMTPILTPPGVVKNPGSPIDFMKLLVAENYSGIIRSGNDLSKRATTYLEVFLTRNEWESWYLPYDALPSPNDRQYYFISKVSTPKIIGVLIESVIKAPLITIKNRLNKTNILWDVTPVPNAQNYFYLDIPKNEMGIQHNNNPIYGYVKDHIITGKSGNFIAHIMMNSGVVLIILIIILFYSKMNGIFRILSCTLPMWFYLIIIFLVCLWQDFRYYYFIFPVSFFALLTAITYNKLADNKYHND